MSKFKYNIRDYEGTRLMELTGNIGDDSRTNFTSIINRIVTKESMVIDLSSVNIITASGLSAFFESSIFAKTKNQRIILLNPPEDFIRLSEDLGYFGSLIFAYSIEEARKKIEYFV